MTAVPVEGHAQLAAAVPVLHDTDPAGNAFLIPADGSSPPLAIGTLRYRMPDPPDPDQAILIGRHALATLKTPAWRAAGYAAVVAFGPAHIAGPLLDVLPAVAASAGLTLLDVLRVDGGRCWSLLCPDARHRPGGPGLPVDPVDDTVIQLATELGARRG